MQRGMRMAWLISLALSVASATVAMGIAVNQILNDKDLSVTWAGWAFGFSLLVFLLTTAWTLTAPPAGAASARRMTRHRYRRRVRASVEQMETLGLVTQAEYVLRTRQVYVDVVLQPQTVTATTGDSGVGPSQPAPQHTGERAPLASFLARGQALAVLGAAGSGKTTLARYTALDLAERQGWPWRARFWRRRPLPILLYLRDHAEAVLAEPGEDGRRIDLAQAAVAAPWLGGAVTAAWLERQLEQGRCVVLLDGLDEVADGEDRKRVARWVDDQIARYPRNAFVVTSRPHGYDDNRLRAADVLQVQRFTRDQIRAFLHVWYQAIERRAREGDRAETDRAAAAAAEDLFTRINALPALYDLAANPLLLTMIANVHRYRGALPEGRAALYSEMCQVLLHRRQEVKGITDPAVEALSGSQRERIVQELAWHMMRHKLRDIPATDAARVIRDVLYRTAPHLAPQAVLEHVRRSGLLTEHRHDHYGFVHLTLQEYLAATFVPGHHKRRQHLVKAATVNDPWWRETILLWAADADASSVVEACLAESTVTSLSLAYACSEQARELDHVLRERLEEFLTTAPDSPEQARLLDGVAATRALYDTLLLQTGNRLCAQPLSRELWNRYATHAGLPALPPGTEPATGLWPVDIYGFLDWLNSLFTDGTAYRLPLLSEAHQVLHLRPDTSRLWASDDGRATLTSSEPHLHHPTPQQISAYPGLILDHTHLVFRLLSSRSRLTFAQLLAYNRPRDLALPHHQLLHALDIICALHIARAYDQYGPGLSSESSTNMGPPTLARDHTLNLALDRALELERNLERARDHTLARDLVLDLDLALDRARNPDRARDLDRALDRSLNIARNRARALNLTLDRDLDRHLTLAVALDLALALDRHLTLTLTLTLDRDLVLDHARDRDLVLVLDRHLARHLARARDLVLDHARDRDLALALDLDLDLAFARAMASHDLGRFQETSVAVDVGRVCVALILAASTPQERNPAQSGRTLRQRGEGLSLSRFLAAAVERFSGQPTDDPESALRQAAHLASERGALQVAESIENARALAAPLWDRSRPARQGDAVLAVTTLLALLTDREMERQNPKLSDLLCGVVTTLIALTPDTGRQEETQSGLVFLVRE